MFRVVALQNSYVETLTSNLFIFYFIFAHFKNFFKLWKYDNTFTGNLENTEQSYI